MLFCNLKSSGIQLHTALNKVLTSVGDSGLAIHSDGSVVSKLSTVCYPHSIYQWPLAWSKQPMDRPYSWGVNVGERAHLGAKGLGCRVGGLASQALGS